MRRLCQLLRAVRTGLLAVAALAILLYAASYARIWWSRPPRFLVGASNGVVVVRYVGSGATVTGETRGWTLGDRKTSEMTFGSRGITMRVHSGWVFRSSTAVAAPATGPGQYSHLVRIFPSRLALIAAPMGLLLLLVPTRKVCPGCCVACGYSRAGLSPDAICPECGAGLQSTGVAAR